MVGLRYGVDRGHHGAGATVVVLGALRDGGRRRPCAPLEVAPPLPLRRSVVPPLVVAEDAGLVGATFSIVYRSVAKIGVRPGVPPASPRRGTAR